MRLKLLGFLVLLSGLSGCSTTEKPSHSDKSVTAPESIQVVKDTADSLYQKAKLAPFFEKQRILQNARTLAVEEKAWQLLAQICRELDTMHGTEPVDNRLFSTLAMLKQGQQREALSTLAGLNERLANPQQALWYHYLLGSLYDEQALYIQAAGELLQASNASLGQPLQPDDLNQRLWHALRFLSHGQLDNFNNGPNNQRGWINLVRYLQIYLGNPTDLGHAVKGWRLSYPAHPAQELVDTLENDWLQLETPVIKTLAVLLPMSGDNAGLGDAVKAGILAALDVQHVEKTVFIDTMRAPEEIATALSENKADFVIGPLLKANIEKINQAGILNELPALLLNRDETVASQARHYQFALAPEHEIDQALSHFLAAGYQKPMLLAPNNRSGQRLVDYFTQRWLTYSENAPEAGLFNDKQDMQQTIVSLLEVQSSKSRIAAMEDLFKENIESETRSRRDIDVIYLLGDAVQTRLLKPYLDVNVSTFVERIPLYASSKSHSLKIDKTDKRDLAGLYFTELPWMLPDSPEYIALRKQFEALWGDDSDLQQRLFAMGHDAVALLPQVSQMAQLPGKQIKGLTGSLSLSEQGEVIRRLRWARYNKRQITQVTLKNETLTPRHIQQLLTPKEAGSDH